MILSIAPLSPLKSGMSTSTLVDGFNLFTSCIVLAKKADPPSGRSSLLTEVITACVSSIVCTLSATRKGSKSSRSQGFPVLTSQNPQALVQVSPIIMNVAVPIDQHSYIFGQDASSQTVLSFFSEIKFFKSL